MSLSSHSLSSDEKCKECSSNTDVEVESVEEMVIAGPPNEKSLEDEILDAVS